MKKIALLLFFCFALPGFAKTQSNGNPEKTNIMKLSEDKNSIHQFTVKTLSGEDFDLATLKGKKVMIVNTASKCGLTPQYAQLQSMYDEFGPDNFVIIGFPSNDFMEQEPGSNQEIATFCQENYGVTFPMMDKISVKGKNMAPLYKFLTQKQLNNLEDNEVTWNFQKYLIDEQGHLVKVISPRILPNDPEIKQWLKAEK